MYQEFFGLDDLPFELTPNPKFVFLTARHREALSNLLYGLTRSKAVTVLIGEAGTGKTTLLRTVIESDACRRIRCVSISNPTLTRAEFVETLARGFGLSRAALTSKATMLAELQAMLAGWRSSGESVALVVDEAQALGSDLLEEIRLLANLETSEEKLLPLVLAGQPELADRLRLPELWQLKQRVSLRCEIGPFDVSDTAAYIAHRIRVAGGQAPSLFTRDAVMLIHSYARGIPRVINVICDNALVGAFAQGSPRVSAQMVKDVCRDFDLDAGPRTSGAQLPPAARPANALDRTHVAPAPAFDRPGAAAGGSSGGQQSDSQAEGASQPGGERDLFGNVSRPRGFLQFR